MPLARVPRVPPNAGGRHGTAPGTVGRVSDYVPKMPTERIEQLRRWHHEASAELHRLGAHDVDYLGLRLHVPEQVFPPTPTSDLLGRQVESGSPWASGA